MQDFAQSLSQDFNFQKSEFATFYEGMEGIIEVYRDTLTAQTYIQAIIQPSEIHPQLFDWLNKEYVPERVKRNICAYVVLSADNPDQKLQDYVSKSSDELRVVHMVETIGQPFEMEINIYDDKVAFIQYNPKYPLGAVLIKYKPIANTMRAMFLHFLWKSE